LYVSTLLANILNECHNALDYRRRILQVSATPLLWLSSGRCTYKWRITEVCKTMHWFTVL